MIVSTSWKKNVTTATEETGKETTTTTTISFLEDETFKYKQRKEEGHILTEEIFEGDWALLQSNDSSSGKGRLRLTVTHIFAKGPADHDIFEKYFLNMRDRMNRERQEQGKIAKAMNAQQRELEKREMDLGLPGYEKYLQVLEQKVTEEQDQLKHTFKEQKETKLCSCPAVIKNFGIHKENPRWWCVHCYTTECQLCTKPTCYRGLDADHEVEQNLKQIEKEQLRQKILMEKSCRVDLAIRPEYYEMEYVDFVAQWRIMMSSTVVKQFR